ncbi:hypothetical protein M0802_013233 [Mischocyttarus mexicanus]|nr:hypothetical protein M0802_013236 [Mischocyttarus mexicanus]KAI4483885.1 hypothetical protein M0802_013233 [Mischocyttarus mexicanus]
MLRRMLCNRSGLKYAGAIFLYLMLVVTPLWQIRFILTLSQLAKRVKKERASGLLRPTDDIATELLCSEDVHRVEGREIPPAETTTTTILMNYETSVIDPQGIHIPYGFWIRTKTATTSPLPRAIVEPIRQHHQQDRVLVQLLSH